MNYKSLKSIVFSLVVAFMVIGFQSCSQDDEFSPETVKTRAKPVVTIAADSVISSSTTWSSTNDYLLQGKVWVKAPATLTIEAGTIVRGAYNQDLLKASALVITRGSQLIANGTATNPIILTADENHQFKGGWGGLVLLGDAQINQSPNQLIEGISTGEVPSGVDATYGTNVTTYNNQSSGTLRHVRVEYAGARIAEANELNAFTFGGVGSGTTVEYCQAYYGADDAFEFFGGRVNAKYLVATACDDDAFDFDFGYQGKIQFAVATIDAAQSYSSDPNGIECDNNGSGTDVTPYTHPVLSNLTIVGTSNGQIAGGGSPAGYLYNGARFRRYTQYTLVNSVIYGYPTGVWHNTAQSSTDSITIAYNVVASVPAGNEYVGFAANPPASNNLIRTATTLILNNPWGNPYTTNALKPIGAPANTAGYDINAVDSWFDDTEYKGAINKTGDNWLVEGEFDGWIRNW